MNYNPDKHRRRSIRLKDYPEKFIDKVVIRFKSIIFELVNQKTTNFKHTQF